MKLFKVFCGSRFLGHWCALSSGDAIIKARSAMERGLIPRVEGWLRAEIE